MRVSGFVLAACLALCMRSHAETLVVTGAATDQNGQPVGGAEVWIVYASQPPIVRTKSAEDGTFRLETETGQPESLRSVRAMAAGRALGLAAYGDDKSAGVEIALTPEALIRGRVAGPGDQPVAGAKVRLCRLSPVEASVTDHLSDVVLQPEEPFSCRTGAKGEFALGHLPQQARADLAVGAASFADWQQRGFGVHSVIPGHQARLRAERHVRDRAAQALKSATTQLRALRIRERM
jgi:hypothetical protein